MRVWHIWHNRLQRFKKHGPRMHIADQSASTQQVKKGPARQARGPSKMMPTLANALRKKFTRNSSLPMHSVL